jgi:hypothetical protein
VSELDYLAEVALRRVGLDLHEAGLPVGVNRQKVE